MDICHVGIWCRPNGCLKCTIHVPMMRTCSWALYLRGLVLEISNLFYAQLTVQEQCSHSIQQGGAHSLEIPGLQSCNQDKNTAN